MGGTQMSNLVPVKSHYDSFVAVSICANGKVRIMNAPPDVLEMLIQLDEEITRQWGSTRGPLVQYYGTLKMKVGNLATFESGSGKKPGTMGKIFAIRCFEEMYQLGYNMVVSSDLARTTDNATWFFSRSRVSGEDRSQARVCCIATGGLMNNKLVLLRHDEDVKEAVNLAIQDTWPNGISGTEDIWVVGENLHEIKLNGQWGGKMRYLDDPDGVEGGDTDSDEDGMNTRRLICNMFGRMGGLSLNWRLLASTNLKGTSDSFFFIQDSSFTAHPDNFCMISLNERDRVRLINCNTLAEPLKETVTAAGLVVQEEWECHGCYELKIEGSPWWSEGEEAIRARRLLSRIFEMMGQQSWTPYTAIDVTRQIDDKASFLFRKAPFPLKSKFSCISLTSQNRIRLLDFPVDVGVPLRSAIYEHYPFGVADFVNLPDNNEEFILQEYPWVADSVVTKGYGAYHARALLGRMMRIAEEFGWFLSVSADVSAKYEREEVGSNKEYYAADVHSLYFVKMAQ